MSANTDDDNDDMSRTKYVPLTKGDDVTKPVAAAPVAAIGAPRTVPYYFFTAGNTAMWNYCGCLKLAEPEVGA